MNYKVTSLLLVTLLVISLISAERSGSNKAADDTGPTLKPLGNDTYEADCSKDEDCNTRAGLKCSAGKCDCLRPTEMTYDYQTETCLVLESFSCQNSTEGTVVECTHRAVCTEQIRGNHTEKVCKCEAGYSAAADNKCYGDVGTSCDTKNDTCNHHAALYCHVEGNSSNGTTEGKCGCHAPEDNVYEDGRCKALVGVGCVRLAPPYVFSCVDNATCRMEMDLSRNRTTGICACDRGFKALPNRRCGTSNGVLNNLPSLLAVFGASILIVILE